MVRFRSLASSSEGCAYLLEAEGAAPLLIECGMSFIKLQIALDFRLSRVAGCIVSHAHMDHAEAANTLPKHGVAVYSSKETSDALRKGIFAPRVLKGPTKIGGWLVTPFDAVHDCPGALGFVIEGYGARCLYLTDSAYCPVRFEGLTHIAIECNHSSETMRESVRSGKIDPVLYARTAASHMSLERLLPMLKANDLSRVQEVHLLHLSDANSDERAFKEAVQQATGCPVYVAQKTGLGGVP